MGKSGVLRISAISALAMVCLLVAGQEVQAADTFQIDGTGAHDVITLTGINATTLQFTVNGSAPVDLMSIKAIVINGYGGNDAIVINNKTTTILTSITIHCQEGDDHVYVSFESPVDITIHGGEGDDIFRIHPSSTATVQVNGGNHVIGDELHVNRHGSKAIDYRLLGEIHIEGFMDIIYTDIEKVSFPGQVVKGKWQRR